MMDLALLIGLVGGGIVVAVANAFVSYRLWRSPLFERPQKVAQTLLLWVVPGSAIVVWHALHDSLPGWGRSRDRFGMDASGETDVDREDFGAGPHWGGDGGHGGHHGGGGEH